MAITDPNKLLEAMGAKVSKRRILLFIIGSRMKDQESGRTVPMLLDCPPFVTWCTDTGFAVPSKDQQTRCLKFWTENPLAPDSYEWIEGSEPVLKITKPKKPKKSNPNKETDDDRT